MSGKNTKVEKPKTTAEENALFAEKFNVEVKDIKWIRVTYGISRTKVGELKESFLKQLQKVIISPLRIDMMTNKTAYPFYDINNNKISLPYNEPIWATRSTVAVIRRLAIFIDSDEMNNVNKEFRVSDPKAKLYASNSMIHAYSVSKIRNMDLADKD